MPGPIVMRSHFPLYMTPEGTNALKMMWEPGEGELDNFRDQYYKVDSTEDPFFIARGTVGLGMAALKPETVPPLFDAPMMGRAFTLVFPTRALAVAISKEAQADDKKNELVPLITSELRNAMNETMEQDAADQYNDAFDYQGWESDGVALASRYHPIIRNQNGTFGGQYWSNRHPTDAAFSITALDVAYTELRKQRNDTGRWLKELEAVYVDFSPDLFPYASQIIGTAKVTGSNNNDINLYYQKLKPRMNPRFTDPNMWSLDCGPKKHSWIWLNRQLPSFETEVLKLPGVTVLFTDARWGRGAVHARGKYFSRGPS
jgi:hypothetical protein